MVYGGPRLFQFAKDADRVVAHTMCETTALEVKDLVAARDAAQAAGSPEVAAAAVADAAAKKHIAYLWDVDLIHADDKYAFYLGHVGTAVNVEFLRSAGISVVVNMCATEKGAVRGKKFWVKDQLSRMEDVIREYLSDSSYFYECHLDLFGNADTQSHSGSPGVSSGSHTGIVKMFSREKGFGFISDGLSAANGVSGLTGAAAPDVYVHIDNVRGRIPRVGDRVAFELQGPAQGGKGKRERGPRAVRVTGCTGPPKGRFGDASSFHYKEVAAMDNATYDLLHDFEPVHAFIKQAADAERKRSMTSGTGKSSVALTEGEDSWNSRCPQLPYGMAPTSRSPRVGDMAQTGCVGVLVHCVMGLNRSAAVLAAFFMLEYGLGAEEAVKLIAMKRRGRVFSNFGFLQALKELEARLNRTAVGKAG